jgi:hypothetical protein
MGEKEFLPRRVSDNIGLLELLMAKTYNELLDLSEFDGQSLMAKYIHHGGDINNYATTWEYVAFIYSLAFGWRRQKSGNSPLLMRLPFILEKTMARVS